MVKRTIIMVMCMWGTAAWSQSATISGTIYDRQGNGLGGVMVTVNSTTSSKVVGSYVSDRTGEYSIEIPSSSGKDTLAMTFDRFGYVPGFDNGIPGWQDSKMNKVLAKSNDTSGTQGKYYQAEEVAFRYVLSSKSIQIALNGKFTDSSVLNLAGFQDSPAFYLPKGWKIYSGNGFKELEANGFLVDPDQIDPSKIDLKLLNQQLNESMIEE